MDAERARHTCHCGKSFIRREHLRRHQATHGERQHVCSVCQRSFTRNDLLKRHLSVHTTSDQVPMRIVQACDACHESKTKCDGGERCSLCTKRGIPCTVSRGRTSKKRGAPGDDDDDDVMVVENGAGDHLRDHQVDTQIGAMNHLNPAPVQGIPLKGATNLAQAGLGSLLELLEAASAGNEPPKQLHSEDLKKWFSSRITAYFGRFHSRWTILHAPLFDATTDSVFVVATVIMIGSILRDEEPTAREAAIRVHDHLMNFCFNFFSEPKDEAPCQSPWPHETYGVALLNIITAFEIGKLVLVRRAARLFSLVCISIRENNIFNNKTMEMHQDKHFPGNFSPWVYMGRDKWRWIASYALQIDAYLSLFTLHPPLLRLNELSLGLPGTFTLRNAFGLDKFFKRLPDEPADRQRIPISDVAQDPQALPSSGVLIEDIQIGLSGLVTKIWAYKQCVQSSFILTPQQIFERDQIEDDIFQWASPICRIFSTCSRPDKDPEAVASLLRSYMGEEEPGEEGWQEPIMIRVSCHLFDISMFYFYLNMHHFAEVQTINNVSSLPPEDTETRVMLTRWAASSSGRKATAFALCALQACEKTFSQNLPTDGTLDPMTRLCLSTASLVFWAWAMNDPEICTCTADHAQTIPNVDLIDKEARDTWALKGGNISVDNVPLCGCTLEVWRARFKAAFGRDARSWEIGEEKMAKLRIQ